MSGYVAVIAVVVAVVFFIKHRRHQEIQQHWKCATAIVEEVRPEVIQTVSNAKGDRTVLYGVSILAKYVSDGVEHEQWVTVEQPPVSLAEAELQTFRWKGQRCVVRWKAAKPQELIAEVD
ncbi:hypothetical protein [Tunturibacter empetritectus]|uniref:Transcriptional regulator n=1 Tax=Tunturiibacter lichenicola TaxID=2051959 RepID=A0A7W8N3X1_9BACT|nr:hypothetical protein [Edaphobacter lichenicola]MBB5343006.1 putative transcriptional regulator [Edaphobacter lichenicola]